MAARRIGPIQFIELLVGVVPSVIFVGPALAVLINGLARETLPGIVRGGSFRGQLLETLFVFLGPIGILALISLCLLILLGPEGVARRRFLRVLVLGSGIPGFAAAIWVVTDSARFLVTRAWESGTFFMALSLTGSTLVGWKYLRLMAPMLQRPAPRRPRELPEYVVRNQQAWDARAKEYEEPGRRAWQSAEPHWGIWNIPESDLRVLPEVAGKDVIELGCGTAYFSAWLARRGARVVGIDNSPAQLATARGFQREFGLEFPVLQAPAEAVPLPDASFDLAVSEYGASIWSDPHLWVPEAARLLRPGGQLIFMVNGTLLMLCVPDEENVPATDRLLRSYFGMHRFDWPGDPAVDFHLSYGNWIRLLRRHGLQVEDLIEVRPPEGSTTRYPYVTLEWARRWPSEEIWKARKRG